MLAKESLTQITNPNLQARKSEHIEVRGTAHRYRVSHWPGLDTHFLTSRPGRWPQPRLWPRQLRSDLKRQRADVTTRGSQMSVLGVAGPRLRGGGTAPPRVSSAQPRVELVEKAEELGAYNRAKALEQWLGGRGGRGKGICCLLWSCLVWPCWERSRAGERKGFPEHRLSAPASAPLCRA